MSDQLSNQFTASGTTAERLAFTPNPATPGSGPDQGYTFWDTDLQALYAWDVGAADWVAAGGGGSGTVTNTGTLTDHALIVGNSGVDVSALASLGTTTTVLHGNAAGDPTFGAVALATDVSGDLPFANLAQIAGLSVLGVTGSATADVAAITAGTDGHVLTRVSSSSLAFAAPASSGGVLGYHIYAPATNTFFTTTSSTLADIDATNMVVTFTAPASGNIVVRLTAYADLSTSAQEGFWGLREGTNNISGAGGVICRSDQGNVYAVTIILTGISAGSHTYKWSYGASGGASFRTAAGPGNTSGTVSTTAGIPPAVMEVWPLS